MLQKTVFKKEVKCKHKAIWFVVILSVIIFAFSIHTYDYSTPSGLYNTIPVAQHHNYTIYQWALTNDISCHQRTDGDALLQLPENFTPPVKSIFMHETSCKGGLNSRQACSIESAARAHPEWHVHLLFSGPISKTVLANSSLAILLTYDNVKMLRIHIKDYAKGTPVQHFYEIGKNPMAKSTYRVEHTSDIMRYLTLYKYGGVYLDTDVIVVKPFDSLASDFSARESITAIDAGVMAFSKGPIGRKVAEAAIEDFRKNYSPFKWGNNGPGVITRVVKEMCLKSNNTDWIKGCEGFVVYDPEVFYPVYYPDNKQYFKADFNLTTSKRTYAHHLWNALTRNFTVPATSPFAKLAREYCPKVYEMYGRYFGA